ncbi:MAG: sugar phosphate isomerase/epimerase family protein [Candidatus Thorarchaeota archaeon]
MHLERFAGACVEAGLQAIELQMEDPYSSENLANGQAKDVLEVIRSHGLKLTLHAPYHDINIASLKEPIRRASVDILKHCIEVAREMDVDALVLHTGKCPEDQVARVELARERMAASLFGLATFASDFGVRLGIENKQRASDRELILYPEEQLEWVSALKDLGAFSVLDLGHANTTGRSPVEYLDILWDTIGEIHLHDNRGTADEHLPLGEGTLPLDSILKRISEFDGTVILELKSLDALQESAVLLTRFI